MADIPDDVVERALSTKTDDCPEGLQYVLVRGLHAMGFQQCSAETWEIVRAAGRVFVEWERGEMKRQIDARLNNYLVDMNPNYDDSITGFNEAWGQMRDAFRSRSADREG